jgi:hypothetical protein
MTVSAHDIAAVLRDRLEDPRGRAEPAVPGPGHPADLPQQKLCEPECRDTQGDPECGAGRSHDSVRPVPGGPAVMLRSTGPVERLPIAAVVAVRDQGIADARGVPGV